MPTYTVTGITLGARKFGDGGRVATFYTLEHGKVEAVARGVGKPASKLAAALEPFTLARLFLAHGRGLDRLAQVEVIESYLPLREDLQRYAYGAYLLELTSVTTEPGHAVPGLFEHLQAALDRLAAGDDPEIIVWSFTLRLLAALGTAPDMDQCVQCGAELKASAGYVAALGGAVCEDCGQGEVRLSGAARGGWRSLLTLPWDRVNRLQLASAARQEISRTIRAHVDTYIGDRLKTVRFLEQITSKRP
jgi:DNA repair protein RecO (recombination protein O)